MASGTITGSTSNEYIDAKIVWSSTADIANNKSTVTAALYYKRNNTGYTTSGTGTFYISIDGTQTSATKTLNITYGSWVKAVEYTRTISHQSNGLKSIIIAASGSISGTTLSSTSVSGTARLDDIPRASAINSLSCSTSYFTGTLTYRFTTLNASFYNRCNITLNLNGTYTAVKTVNLGKKSVAQHTETVTLSESELTTIYKKLPSAVKGTLRFTFRTYSDSGYRTQVGDASYKEISLNIPTSVKPTASLAVSLVNTNTWIKGKEIYVAGYSGLSATLSATAGEGASMAAYSISGGDYSSASGTLSVSKLSSSGQLTLTGTATDSRARSGTASKTITVHPYSVPAVASLEVARGTYNSGWAADDDGSDIRVIFKTTLALATYNNTYKASFALNNAAITPAAGTTSGLSSGASYTVYFQNVDGESSHNFKISVTDAVGESGSATIIIPTVNVTIEFNASGKGIAFGKTSEKDAFECAMDAEFSGSVKRIREDGSVVTLDDTGWIDLGLSDSASTTSSPSAGHYDGCAYRVINGNHVYVAFNVHTTYSGSAVVVSGTAIPSQYRPKLQPYAIVTLNGSRIARIFVSRSTGHAAIDWIRNVSDETEPAEHIATWIDGYIDYWI